MLFRLWNKIIGYAIIRLDGIGSERMLNRIEAAGIPLWDIRRMSRMSLTAKVSYASLVRLRKLAKDNNYTLTVTGRRGILPGFSSVLGRRVFLLCAVAAVGAIIAFTRFVWIIDINGEDAHAADMLARLEQLEIRQGTLWSDVNTITMQKQLMKNNDYAASVIVNRQGVKLTVDIIPVAPPPEYIENMQPCDIVASVDGVVVSVIALDGVPAVEVGQTVKTGDILIKGEFTDEEFSYARQVAARGECVARVWYTGVARVPANEVVREFTGRECRVRKLTIAGLEFDVEKIPEDFGDYIVDRESEQALSSSYIPARLHSQTLKEVNVRMDSRQYSIAEREGQRLAYADALSRLADHTPISDVRYSSSMLPDGELEVRAFIETEEQIGVVQYH